MLELRSNPGSLKPCCDINGGKGPTHELKIAPAPFDSILRGHKKAEFRNNDRLFVVGDTLLLREKSEGQAYTGRSCLVRVTHIQTGFGIPEGYAMLSVEKNNPQPTQRNDERIHDTIDEVAENLARRQSGGKDPEETTRYAECDGIKFPFKGLPHLTPEMIEYAENKLSKGGGKDQVAPAYTRKEIDERFVFYSRQEQGIRIKASPNSDFRRGFPRESLDLERPCIV